MRMSPSCLPRLARRLVPGRAVAPVALALAALGALAAACGPKPTVAPVIAPPGSASAPASGPVAPTPLPSGLPPALPVPPMGVRGSTRARVLPDPDAACPETHAGRGAPAAAVKQLADACGLRPAAPALSGTLGDADPAKSGPLRVKKGQCYRLLVAHEPALQDVVVVLRDSLGAVAAVGPEVAVPASGKVCFEADDDATVMVSAGTGRGAFVVQVVER